MPELASDGWRALIPPQPMPEPEGTGRIESNGASIYFSAYGEGNDSPVMLLHGGLGAGVDFGGQIAALARNHHVVAVDSRGHGRSTVDSRPLDLQVMASDVLGVMDHLGIQKVAIVGWSDGGNIGIELAINNPERLTKLFALGANYSVSGVRPSAFADALILAYVARAAEQYALMSATPDNFEEFSGKVFALWGTEPPFTEKQISKITAPTIIAAGVYEEAIDENHTRSLAELIPGAQLMLIDNASHFAHWQQPNVVNDAILEFLDSS